MTRNTIADLKTYTPQPNELVTVLGYYAPGDGGGGDFYLDSASAETDNGGTIIQGVATGRWKRTFSGVNLNVQWFGAKNDYTTSITTDNTATIQATVNAAKALQVLSNPVSVYFPYGQGFRITDTINVPSSVGVVMDGIIYFDNILNDRPALVIGDSIISIKLKHRINVTNKNFTIWPAEDVNGDFDRSSVGVKFINHYHCDILVRGASNFTIGVQCIGSGNGFVYNEVRFAGLLAYNKVGIELTGEANGWCNENSFYGGRWAQLSRVDTGCAGTVGNDGKTRYGIIITSIDGTYLNHNNNNFYKPSFELREDLANLAAPGCPTNGTATPLRVDHGLQNAIYNCRHESNSNILVITKNNSAQNTFDIGFGTSGTFNDLGDSPSTLMTKRGRVLQDKNYIKVYDSGDLLRKVCPYDATNAFASDELFFLSSSNSSTVNFITSIIFNSDSIQLPGSRGIGVRIDTRINKRFLLKSATVSGAPGRPAVRCFDSSGNILYDAVTPYVKGYPSFIPNPVSAFGGHYAFGSDNSNPFYFKVDTTVDHIDVFYKGGTNPCRIRQFEVQAIDGPAAVISLKKKRGLFAIQAPATGDWLAGDIIWNNNPTSNNILLWQCSIAGTPGTWITVSNGNSVVGAISLPKTTNYTITAADYTIPVNSTSGNIAITLPASGIQTGQVFNVVKTVAANAVIIDPVGAATISGQSNYTITSAWDKVTVQFDGANYIII